jgi:hypothetical protein
MEDPVCTDRYGTYLMFDQILGTYLGLLTSTLTYLVHGSRDLERQDLGRDYSAYRAAL